MHDRDAQRITGYTADEITGKSFTVLSSVAAVRDGKPARELAAAVSLGRHRDLGWRVRKDSSMFWANVVITAIVDAEGALKGFAKVTRDETDRKRRASRLAGGRGTSRGPLRRRR